MRLTRLATAVAVVAGLILAGAPAQAHYPQRPVYTLTILHNNDGESQLVSAPGQPDFGGVARFKTLVDQLRHDAVTGRPGAGTSPWRGALMLSSGDNFLAGPEFAASLDKGVPFYDSLALQAVGYDAMAIGNHEFDFGPDVLADFIEGFGQRHRHRGPPFVSANLDMSEEPRLAELVRRRAIVAGTTLWERGARIGTVGATTPDLASISSPRRVKVLKNVAELVQAQVDGFTSRGINKVILISHLQGLSADRALIPMLHDVDVVIAGGGDELLANEDDLLVPGDSVATDPVTGEPLRYPLQLTDAEGAEVPVVTTAGDYKYVGRLVVNFDWRGRVLSVGDNSGPVRVSGVGADAVIADPHLVRTVVEPVQEFIAELASTVVAESEVALEGRREPGVRTEETNLGNLLADSLLAAGQRYADEYGVTPPQVALQNGGGIRNNSLIPPGELTLLTTFDVAPFPNFVAVVPDVPRAQFKELLENAVSRAPFANGRFAQVAGFRFSYDPARTAQVVDDDGNVLTPGERVRDVVLDDGTVLVADGVVVDGSAISLATNDFTARGGDQYPFRSAPFTTVGVTYQQALRDYLTEDLAGVVTAAAYPEGGSGRITTP